MTDFYMCKKTAVHARHFSNPLFRGKNTFAVHNLPPDGLRGSLSLERLKLAVSVAHEASIDSTKLREFSLSLQGCLTGSCQNGFSHAIGVQLKVAQTGFEGRYMYRTTSCIVRGILYQFWAFEQGE